MVPNLFRNYFGVGDMELDAINELEGALEEAGFGPDDTFYADLISRAAQGGVDYLGELYRYAVEKIEQTAENYGLTVADSNYYLNASNSSGTVIIAEPDEDDLEDPDFVEELLGALQNLEREIGPLTEYITVGVGSSLYDYQELDSYIGELEERLEEMEEDSDFSP